MRFYRVCTRFVWLALLCAALAGCVGTLLPTPAPLASMTPEDTVVVALPLTPASPAAATLTPTPSSSPTAHHTPTPTLTATPTPTPSPTLPPGALYEAALSEQSRGNYEEAIAGLESLLAEGSAAHEMRDAAYHLAALYAQQGDSGSAAAKWEEFIAAYPDDARLPAAHLAAGRAYAAQGQCARAIVHYEACLEGEPLLGAMVYEWIGDCHQEGGDLEAALAAYQKALVVAKDVAAQAALRETIATIYLALPDWEAALAEYEAVLKIARTDATRARMEYMAGETLAVLGRTDDAHERYRRAVSRYPATGSAYLSLIRMVEAEQPVDDYQRGLVDYYAGANFPDAYGAALSAFDRYLAAKPAPKSEEALYFKSLVYAAQEQYSDALETLDLLIKGFPKGAWAAEAWLEKGEVLAAAGEHDAAVKAYQDMAAYFPEDKLAPEALWSAARLRERDGDFALAAGLYEELQGSFPAYEYSAEALWRAGLAHHRSAGGTKAERAWQALADKYPTSSYYSACLYWLGKVGNKSVAKASWDRLVEADPHGYYGLRVQQIRGQASLTGSRLVLDEIEAPAWDDGQAEAAILTWLRGWTSVPTGTVLVDLPESLASRTDYRQGSVLLVAGMRREALAAYDGTRAAAWSDPVALAQLAMDFRELGLHGLSARCASRMVGLWPNGVVQDAPEWVQRLAYPLLYADLLSVESLARNLDPLLLAALIRQESLFEPTAESYAGARGLGQVMPATGEGIAKSLGMEDFGLDDLYRPAVSIRFCAFYLAAQMGRFDDQVLIALAAYHGGPGNTIRWLETSGDDLDLFVEILTAPQSRIYLQRVYEQYITYEDLYR